MKEIESVVALEILRPDNGDPEYTTGVYIEVDGMIKCFSVFPGEMRKPYV